MSVKNYPKWTNRAFTTASEKGEYIHFRGEGASSTLLITGAEDSWIKYLNGGTPVEEGPRIYIPSLRAAGTYGALLNSIVNSKDAQHGNLSGQEFLDYHIKLGSYQPGTVMEGYREYDEKLAARYRAEIAARNLARKSDDRKPKTLFVLNDVPALLELFKTNKVAKSKQVSAPKKTAKKAKAGKRGGGGSVITLQTRLQRVADGQEYYVDVDAMTETGAGAKNVNKKPSASSKKIKSALADAPEIYASPNKAKNYRWAMALLGAEYLKHADAFEAKNTVGLVPQPVTVSPAVIGTGFIQVPVDTTPVSTVGVSPVLTQLSKPSVSMVSPVVPVSQGPGIPFLSPKRRAGVLSPGMTAAPVKFPPIQTP